MITIDLDRYTYLCVTDMKMDLLDQGGVDNWGYYGDALNPDDEPTFDEAEDAIYKECKEEWAQQQEKDVTPSPVGLEVKENKDEE